MCSILDEDNFWSQHRSVSFVVFAQTDHQIIPTDHLLSGSQFPQSTHVAVIIQPPNIVPLYSRSLLHLVGELISLVAIGFLRVFLRSLNQLRPLCLGWLFTHWFLQSCVTTSPVLCHTLLGSASWIYWFCQSLQASFGGVGARSPQSFPGKMWNIPFI